MAYLNFIFLCWLGVGGAVISILSFGNILAFMFYAWLLYLLPYIYQKGLDVADFENAQNMFELDSDDEDDDSNS